MSKQRLAGEAVNCCVVPVTCSSRGGPRCQQRSLRLLSSALAANSLLPSSRGSRCSNNCCERRRSLHADEDGHWRLAAWDARILPLEEIEFVALDVESTGLAPGRHRLLEVAAVVVRGGELRAQFQQLINPEPRDSAVHHPVYRDQRGDGQASAAAGARAAEAARVHRRATNRRPQCRLRPRLPQLRGRPMWHERRLPARRG